MCSTVQIIKMPRGLPTKLAFSKRHRKSISLLLFLKAVCEEGRFKATKAQYIRYANSFNDGICYNTFITYINHLQELNLVSKKEGMLYLASWTVIRQTFDLTSEKFYHYKQKNNSKTKIEDFLEAKAMQEVMQRNRAAFYFWLSVHFEKYPEDRKLIQSVAGSTKRSDIERSQLEQFLVRWQGLDDNTLFALELRRADINCSYRYWWDFFWYNSRGGFAYKKRKLASKGLIEISPRIYELERHTTRKARQWKCGTIHYDPRLKKAVLRLPDAITFKPLNNAA